MTTVPEIVGGYHVKDVIGTGGMGTVYRVEHSLLGRPAALKVLLAEHSHDHDTVSRFFNEAKAAAAIRHPGIVEVYDFGYLPDGAAYLVLELLDGESLSARLRARGRLPEPEALAIVRGIASALAAAHAKGIVHRDIKPDNIFLVPDLERGGDRVKVLDFGIAKLMGESGHGHGPTQSGVILGTPAFMAPEQCRAAARVDHRADLYAVGCVLMQLLTGAGPFDEHGGTLERIAAHLHTPAPSLRSRVPAASERADALVARLLAKDPADRIQSAAELAALLADVPAIAAGARGAGPSSPHAVAHEQTTLSASVLTPRRRTEPRRAWAWAALLGGASVGVTALIVIGFGRGDAPELAATPGAVPADASAPATDAPGADATDAAGADAATTPDAAPSAAPSAAGADASATIDRPPRPTARPGPPVRTPPATAPAAPRAPSAPPIDAAPDDLDLLLHAD